MLGSKKKCKVSLCLSHWIILRQVVCIIVLGTYVLIPALFTAIIPLIFYLCDIFNVTYIYRIAPRLSNLSPTNCYTSSVERNKNKNIGSRSKLVQLGGKLRRLQSAADSLGLASNPFRMLVWCVSRHPRRGSQYFGHLI